MMNEQCNNEQYNANYTRIKHLASSIYTLRRVTHNLRNIAISENKDWSTSPLITLSETGISLYRDELLSLLQHLPEYTYLAQYVGYTSILPEEIGYVIGTLKPLQTPRSKRRLRSFLGVWTFARNRKLRKTLYTLVMRLIRSNTPYRVMYRQFYTQARKTRTKAASITQALHKTALALAWNIQQASQHLKSSNSPEVI